MGKVSPIAEQLKKRGNAKPAKSDKQSVPPENVEFDDDPLNYVYDSKGKQHQIKYDERKILEGMNDEYTHSVISGKHVLLRTVYNPVEGESISFEPKNEFKNYFLTEPGIGGLNRGNAWMGWPGKNMKLGGCTFQPAVHKVPDDVYNLFRGYRLEPKDGDCKPFLDHVLYVICAGDVNIAKAVMQFFAHMLQKPDEKPSWAILMKSLEGTGKGTLMRPFLEILGACYIYLNGEDQLIQRFNYCVANRLLMFIDEVQVNDPKVYNKIKGIISEPTITMEPKGIDVFQVPNLARLVFTSNHERVLIAGQRERRFLVVTPDAQHIGDAEYFNRYYQWLENGGASCLLHHLLNLDISDFNPHKAPVTQALIDEKLISMKDVQHWFYEYLDNARRNQPLPVRLDCPELVQDYRNWSAEKLRKDLKLKSAETQVGNLMTSMGIKKSRPAKFGPRFYEFLPIEDMEQRFAETLGHKREEVFS